jgi:hypothetical protein
MVVAYIMLVAVYLRGRIFVFKLARGFFLSAEPRPGYEEYVAKK